MASGLTNNGASKPKVQQYLKNDHLKYELLLVCV